MLRPATFLDFPFYYALRNDPLVQASSRSPMLGYDRFLEGYTRRLASGSFHLLLWEPHSALGPIGALGVEIGRALGVEIGLGRRLELSWAIVAHERRKGHARRMLEELFNLFPQAHFAATIRPTNEASIALAIRLDFKKIEHVEHIEYIEGFDLWHKD